MDTKRSLEIASRCCLYLLQDSSSVGSLSIDDRLRFVLSVEKLYSYVIRVARLTIMVLPVGSVGETVGSRKN